ncbi:MAG TPA: hypothetical protein VEP46_08940 [Vicinamibacterales bacterium]|nr:hypothetical protein [Vicinamibacterales bacterium]
MQAKSGMPVAWIAAAIRLTSEAPQMTDVKQAIGGTIVPVV